MSFQQGLSGLNAASRNLDVIGNNVANGNTYGFKLARAEFSDVYANTLSGGGSNSIGIGTQVTAVSQQFTQGNITVTENPLDIAINGNGFFQMHDLNGQTVYSRNGQFKLDKAGYIVNNGMQRLQGYSVDINGNATGNLSDLLMPTSGISPKASTEGTLVLNLDARKAVGDTYSTSMTTYDAQGIESTVTFTFEKTAANAWDMTHAVNGVDAGVTVPMTFNAAGGLISPATATANGVVLNISGATQWGSSFNVTRLYQNGYTSGDLVGVTMEDDGKVTARYSNGQSAVAGQVELASFPNPQGLQPLGGNAWASTAASGARIPNFPGAGNVGVLQSGALEESNVDVTAELVSMITAQRNYQANAQTIKTQDQIMQTLVNLR